MMDPICGSIRRQSGQEVHEPLVTALMAENQPP
jgi:hypothetical protein